MTTSVAMPQPCLCMRTARHCTLSLPLEQWHLSGLCGDTDEPFGFRKRREDVWKLCHIFRSNRCVMLVALLGWRDQCHLGTPAMCFPRIFPGQEFLLLPRLFQCFSILSTRSLFSYYLNHSCHRLGLFLPAQPWKLSGSLSLQQPFMHFIVNLSFLGLPTHVIRSQASAQVGFSSSYCQVVPVFLDVAQTQGLLAHTVG